MPIIGMEPAVKPAVTATKSGMVGVLATIGTLESARFAALLERYAGEVKIVTQGCPGLVEQVELGDLHGIRTRELIARYTAPLLEKGADTLILGCTHYPFLAPLIRDVVGEDITLIDTGAAVARQLQRRLLTKLPARSARQAQGERCLNISPAAMRAGQPHHVDVMGQPGRSTLIAFRIHIDSNTNDDKNFLQDAAPDIAPFHAVMGKTGHTQRAVAPNRSSAADRPRMRKADAISVQHLPVLHQSSPRNGQIILADHPARCAARPRTSRRSAGWWRQSPDALFAHHRRTRQCPVAVRIQRNHLLSATTIFCRKADQIANFVGE